MKKLLSIFLIVTTFYTLPVLANNNIKVNVNNEVINFDVQPQIINGRTYVPMRAIFEKLGADVVYDNSTNTVTATKDDTYFSMVIGQRYATINGKTDTIEAPAKVINNRTLAPIRVIAESFSCKVNWNESTKEITITTSDYVTPPTVYKIPSDSAKDKYYNIATNFIKKRLRYPNTAVFSKRNNNSVVTSGNDNSSIYVKGYVSSQSKLGVMKEVPFTVYFDQERQLITLYNIDGASDDFYILNQERYQIPN